MSHAQEVFDKVVTHLLTQNEKAIEWSRCAYRIHKDGKTLKCAVGCLISDSVYSTTLEMSGVRDYDVKTALIASGINIEDSVLGSDFLGGEEVFEGETDYSVLGMLEELQYIHDGSSPSEWRDALKDLAHKFYLTFNPPDEIRNA